MRHSFRLPALCLVLLTTSCTGPAGGPDKDVVPEYFAPRDVERLERFGGTYVPTGEGTLATKTPVDSIHFDKRTLDDRSFEEVFPAVQQMDPRILSLDGHKITDKSIEHLNRLKSLRQLSLRNTNVTMKGLRKLDVEKLQSLHVSEEKFNEKQRAELAEIMNRVGRGRDRT
jgi:hypothetical protein